MAAYGDPAIVRTRIGLTYAELGFADDPSYTAFLLAMNERASQAVIDYTQRDFDLHEDEEALLDGNDLNTLALPGYPVVSVVEVLEDGELVAATDYRLLPGTPGVGNSGILERRAPDLWWAGAWERYAITYDWGFTTPPASVKGVVENLMVRAVQGRQASFSGSQGATSYSMDGFAVAYDVAALRGMMTVDDQAVLNAYKRIVAV
jgi:hypothetical protein